jgi:hypothetical protein
MFRLSDRTNEVTIKSEYLVSFNRAIFKLQVITPLRTVRNYFVPQTT